MRELARRRGRARQAPQSPRAARAARQQISHQLTLSLSSPFSYRSSQNPTWNYYRQLLYLLWCYTSTHQDISFVFYWVALVLCIQDAFLPLSVITCFKAEESISHAAYLIKSHSTQETIQWNLFSPLFQKTTKRIPKKKIGTKQNWLHGFTYRPTQYDRPLLLWIGDGEGAVTAHSYHTCSNAGDEISGKGYSNIS